jgi:hypothetical protein
MKIAYVAINLWGYEKILPVPEGLPKGVVPFYVIDSPEGLLEVGTKGWNGVYLNDSEVDDHKRRIMVALIQSNPEYFIDLKDYDYAFVCDSNIVTLPSNYKDFVTYGINSGKVLLTESGYYSGDRDNIYGEYLASNQPRWQYNYKAMELCVSEYVEKMQSMGIDYRKESVSSGKYIGWNLRNDKKEMLANFICGEAEKHVQGNIIITMARVLFPELVSNFRSLKGDGALSGHNFAA